MWRVMRSGADWIEALGVGATVACLIHCLALPLLLTATPVLAVSIPLPASFHVVALLLAIPATGGALYAGYRRHRLALPMVAGGAGLVLLTVAALSFHGHPLETVLTVIGSLAIAGAHAANWRFRRSHYIV
jgi:hypothetical protein